MYIIDVRTLQMPKGACSIEQEWQKILDTEIEKIKVLKIVTEKKLYTKFVSV